MTARFTVPGEPRGKGRPRYKKIGGFVKPYTPEETASYENLIKLEYERQCGGMFFGKGEPVTMTVNAYYSIPKSTSKKKANLMREGAVRPMKKPDADNVLKTIADAVNGIAYHDDLQVVEAHVNRFYGDVPRVEVTISPLITVIIDTERRNDA